MRRAALINSRLQTRWVSQLPILGNWSSVSRWELGVIPYQQKPADCRPFRVNDQHPTVHPRLPSVRRLVELDMTATAINLDIDRHARRFSSRPRRAHAVV